jgi:uncharacterized protein (TIGR03083 family)
MADNIWPVIHAERKALADDLAGLSDTQWQTRSLCADWTVHEVLAHLLSLAQMTPPKFIASFAGSGFNFDKYAAKQVAEKSAGGSQATLAAFRAAQSRTSSPPGPKESWLGEAFVHGEDIRRPLGLTGDYPTAEVTRVIGSYAGSNVLIGGKRRVAGLTLQATDADYSIGSGRVVQGPALALLLATAGRRVALEELSGPGVDELRSRV